MPEDEFGFGGQQTIVPPDEETNEEAKNNEEKEDLAGDKDKDDLGKGNDNKNDNKNDDNKNNENNDDNKGEESDLIDKIKPGVELEIGNTIYKVDNDGNLVDEKGEIFKKADEVADYVKTLEQSDEDGKDELNIDAIQEAIGIEITDENGKDVKFENTPEGIKQYVNAVIETQQQEIAETTINTLFDKYPIVKDFLDYYVANGNSAEGFNSEARSYDIDINDNDESQQESIIRLAWKEQNRKGNVDDYIAYLKSSGKLLSVAEEELEGLKEADKEQKAAIAERAKQLQKEEQERQEKYWQGVKTVIDSKQIAGYKIPDTIIIEREGKKIAATPNDFFNYIYRIDREGLTQYQRDLMKETEESRRDDEILRAYLKFSGGNYSNLVDMAIAKKEIDRLKFKSKATRERKTTIKVKSNSTETGKNVDLGY